MWMFKLAQSLPPENMQQKQSTEKQSLDSSHDELLNLDNTQLRSRPHHQTFSLLDLLFSYSNTGLQMWVQQWSACQVASLPPTHASRQPARQDKSIGSSHYGGSRGVLTPLSALQREAVRGNTAEWSASKQEEAQPPPPAQPASMVKGKWGVYKVWWGLQGRKDEMIQEYLLTTPSPVFFFV